MARFRFGIFDFDPETCELRRHGFAVRLQAQPSQVLSVLLANAGQVVARETLQREVWGGETFVDFDRGLNFCIAQIRTALGDSADSPRFIKTLPKRGYQFIAPVEVGGQPDKAPTPTPAFSVSRVVLTVVVALAVGAGLLIWFQASIRGPKSFAPVTVAVMHFDNETGSSAADQLSTGLTDAVVVEMAGSAGGRYSVIGNAAILRVPRSQRDLIAIGSSLGASYVVLGQVQRDQSKTRVLAHLIRLPEQKHLAVVRMDGQFEEALRFEAEVAKKVAADFGAQITADAARRNASPPAASY
jgi:DNA-binding winged helix-turn-helix (wHTH) protein/TolB-like protein